MPIIDQV
jgi:hypothetical protein